MTVNGYRLAVDWSGNGDYSGAHDDVTSALLDEPTLQTSHGRDTTQALAPPAAGKLEAGLRNDDRKFSPENAASPLAGLVLPGRGVQLRYDGTGGSRVFFDGVIDDLGVDPHAPAKDFGLVGRDAWGSRDAERLSTPVYSGLRTGDAIGLVLDAIGWTGDRDIDPGVTVMPWWWEEDVDAGSAVEHLVDAEGPPAIAYVDGGTFVFRDRHHRMFRSASMTSQGTFTHLVPAASLGDFKVLADTFTYDHGLKRIANSVEFTVEARRPGPEAEVWSSDDVVSLIAGETYTVDVSLADPVIYAKAPFAEPSLLLQSGSVTTLLSRTSGRSFTITVTATSDTVLTRLAVRATPLVPRNVKITAEDPSSVAKYGRKDWPRSVPFANTYDATAIAQRIVAIYASHRPVVTFEIANINDAHMQQIVQRRVSDRITVRNDEIGLNQDMIVESIAHTIIKLGAIHKLKIGCEVPEPQQGANVFTFDVAGRGFNDGQFGVDGIDNPAEVLRFDVSGQGFNQGVFGT